MEMKRVVGFGGKGLVVSLLELVFVVVSCCSLAHPTLGYPMLARSLRRMSARSISTTPLFGVTSTTFVANSSTSTIPSNQELVSRRMQVARAKKDARKQSAQQVHERNLQYKRMLHNDSNTTFDVRVPPMYAVKVSVCDELREELRLNGREKRGRVFVETNSTASQTIKGLKQELHSFFRCLRKSTYILHASLPEGTVLFG